MDAAAGGERRRRAPGLRALGAAGGLLAPALFLAATVGVTVADRAFVADSPWSAVHRTEVGWPSVVQLGPHGGLVVAAFVVCGALVVGLAAAVWSTVPGAPALRLAAVLTGIAGLALCAVAVPQDPLGTTGPPSWQDRVHSGAYPFIPICGTLAAALVWAGGRRRHGWRGMARFSLATVALAAPAFVLTGLDPVAQLARYPLFGALLAWLAALAVTTLRLLPADGGPPPARRW